MFRLGKELGAKQTGTSVYELPPGQALCPYHYEYGEEEWLLVLDGRPTLRDPEGSSTARAVRPGVLPEGPRRRPQGPQRHRRPRARPHVLERRPPAATVYPDSDKVGVWTGDKAEDVMVVRSSNVEYFHGEA